MLGLLSRTIVNAGTGNLETALLNTPQGGCDQLGGGKLFYTIMESLLKVKYVSLVNLIVDKPVVPELLGYKLTAEAVIEQLQKILPDGEPRERMLAGYKEMTDMLAEPGAPDKAASLIVESLSTNPDGK